MDQVKVGNYIAQKRKALGLTQKELAEMILVTDKSISKWERGNGLPDVTRLKPLCDALKVSVNELISGEDIDGDVLAQKTEENIMNLIKENETQKKNGVALYIMGGVLALLAVCLLGISMEGSSVQSVAFFVDPITLLFILLFVGIGVLISKSRCVKDICIAVQKLSIPSAVFISLFQAVMVLGNISEVAKLGPALATAFLAMLYGVALYIIATIIRTHLE